MCLKIFITLWQVLKWREEMDESLQNYEVLGLLKKLGVPFRHPHSNFYKEGNDSLNPLKSYGICDYDEEGFFHKPYSLFSCHIPGCDREFETVIQYEAHYNSCHSFTCNECKKNLPNSHLLDLHISETHDSFFMELAKRKPMFKCFLEECKEYFKNSTERRDHCIAVHKFPSDFRFDASRKTGQKKKKKKSSSEHMEIDESNDSNCGMNSSGDKFMKTNPTKSKVPKGFTFGQGQRKSVFFNFSKDLKNSLPES